MLVAVAGTPGVGKTTLCEEMERRGSSHTNLRDLIMKRGISEGVEEGSGEIIVDISRLEEELAGLNTQDNELTLLDGHLSYLAPSDLCLVLRLNPKELKGRLEERGYDEGKVRENVEAEAVSVVLVEALEQEGKRLKGRPWSELPPRCGIVLEIDVTGMCSGWIADTFDTIVKAYHGKMLNELVEYRPGRVDWLEVVAGWF